MTNNVVISNNSKHNNCSNHKPLTGLQYHNNQMAIPTLLLVIIYVSSITIIKFNIEPKRVREWGSAAESLTQ